MNSKYRGLIFTAALIVVLIAGFLLMGRNISVTIDGQTSQIHTRALTVAQALRGMGITLTANDRVEPSAATWLSKVDNITLDRSRPFIIWVDPIGTQVDLTTPAKTAREALALIGITPTDGDEVRLNGSPIQLDDSLPAGVVLLLQYSPAIRIQLSSDGQQQLLRSSAATIGQALWENGVKLSGGDQLSLPFTQALTSALELDLTRAVPITISVDGKTIQTTSAAKTVGEALAANALSLQNLDYSSPNDESPLPQDGKIRVVRVALTTLVEQKVVPFKIEYTPDPSLKAGTSVITQAGQNGLSIMRTIIRYEDGKEVSRDTQTEAVLQTAVNEQVSTGPQTLTQTSTEGAIGTVDTGVGTLAYYLTATVHVTSYSPCRSGGSTCLGLTASGIPVTQGVLGVTSAWYKILRGYDIYIPGYGIGTVEDIGAGIPGEYWIDLGYSDADWVNWSKRVTVYFLTPKPPNFSGSLP